jgi:hypothetical protein
MFAAHGADPESAQLLRKQRRSWLAQSGKPLCSSPPGVTRDYAWFQASG